MKLILKQFTLIASLIFWSLFSFSQHKGHPYKDAESVIEKKYHSEKETDTALIYQQIPESRDTINYYKKIKDFGYVNKMDSLLKVSGKINIDTFTINKTSHALPKRDQSSASSTNSFSALFNSLGMKIFLWTLAIVFILFIIYRLFLADSLFKKRLPEILPQKEEETEEQITEPSGYDRLIRQAMAAKDYRLAIRYLYLQTLHKMSGAELIQFTPDKTNYQYVREVFNKPWKNDFASLTLNYEYVWYGHFDVDEEVCKRLEADFKLFQEKI